MYVALALLAKEVRIAAVCAVIRINGNSPKPKIYIITIRCFCEVMI